MTATHRTVIFCCLLLLLAGTAQAQDVVGDLLGRINTLRSSLGLPPYALNAALSSAAQSQAQWMVDSGEVSHTRPDGSNPRSRAAAAGYGSNWVSENIYMGTLATVDSAWDFWMNSPIHYAGLTSVNYGDVGIGTAGGAGGHSFVLVFGNPGGLIAPPVKQGNTSASAGPPPYLGGVDEHGNLKHIVQQDDTLGDIALLYGYTWADVPLILELNGMTQDDIRYLEVGSILLIPPHSGTYTPTPGGPTETPTLMPTQLPAGALVAGAPSADLGIVATPTNSVLLPTFTPMPSPTPILPRVATAQSVPETLVALVVTFSPTATPTSTGIAVAAGDVPTPLIIAPTLAVSGSSLTASGSPTSPWLIAAVVVQIGIVLIAAVEFFRRVKR